MNFIIFCIQSSDVGKPTVTELSDKEIVQPNTFVNNDGNRKRQLNDDKREEHTSITNRVKPNETDKTEVWRYICY